MDRSLLSGGGGEVHYNFKALYLKWHIPLFSLCISELASLHRKRPANGNHSLDVDSLHSESRRGG